MPTETTNLPWHALNGQLILDLLKRAAAGEDPDLLYLELYANSEKGDE